MKVTNNKQQAKISALEYTYQHRVFIATYLCFSKHHFEKSSNSRWWLYDIIFFGKLRNFYSNLDKTKHFHLVPKYSKFI